MKTKDFLRKHDACSSGAKWALSIGKKTGTVWNAMIKQGKHDWLIWTATRLDVFPDSALRKVACRFVRETPLSDGRKVWDLLTDERSRKAVEAAELYADGKATYEELEAAYTAAYAVAFAAFVARAAATHDAAYKAAVYAAFAASDAAAYAADAAAYAAAYDAVRAATGDAADAAARAAAKAAQAQMIAEMGNPFKERVKQ